MLAFKILLKFVVIGFVIQQFISTYQKERANGVEEREAFQKAGNSALGVFRTAATAVFVLFGFDNTSHDIAGTDSGRGVSQTSIGFVNAIHNEIPVSNHDVLDAHNITTLDTQNTTSPPPSNAWDFASSALPWALALAAIPIILF